MTETELLRQYEKLRQELLETGPICEGSLTRVLQECGRPACHCHREPRFRHGPYYLWTRKVKGKTVTRQIPETHVAQCRAWIQNNRRLTRIVRRMRTMALRAAPWNRSLPARKNPEPL